MVTAGYDVGGAHLKVALAEGGTVTAVGQIACPLWEGVERLDEAMRAARPLVERAQHHAVTMTGEMCELFPDRKSGVLALTDRLELLLGKDLRVYMGPRGFGSVQEARVDPAAVASMNFFATAECAARHIRNALVIDKWFALQASSLHPNATEHVNALADHPDFTLKNPNRVRSLYMAFAANPHAFHADDGEGYRIIADLILALDPINPQTAARFVPPLGRWRRIEPGRAALMREQLERIAAAPKLSRDTYEQVSRSLG
jgi:hypothetical protein